MDCPAALWLSRTDVSCDKRSCRCHPGRADTLHTLYWLQASPSLSPLLDGTTAVPKWISNESICQGLFAAGLDLMLLLCRWKDWLQEPRAAGGQHLPQAWPGDTEAHLNKQRTETDKGWKQFLLSMCLPLKQHPPMIPQHTLVFVSQSLVASLSRIPAPATCSSFIFPRHSCICK